MRRGVQLAISLPYAYSDMYHLPVNVYSFMSDSSPSSDRSSSPVSNVGVPAAIVLAGGLIALAIYFGGGQDTSVAGPAAGQPGVAGTAGQQPPAEPAVGDIREITEEDHIRGAQNAKVTIIEYSDLECPFCKSFHPTLQQVLREYPNDVRWVYRHFPLEQLHQQAPKEAVATECANEQGKFWELLDKIYEVTPSNDGLDLATLPTLAREVGVPNIAQFESCLNADKYADTVAADLADAQAAGGRGTPYSVAIGPDGTKKAISGAQPYSAVKETIDSLLK